MVPMRLSVVVPTRDRTELLKRGLEGLIAQTLDARRFEVLVVDDGSAEPPVDLVRSFEGRLPIRLLVQSNGGLASARNRGAAAATGDVLVFMDDDIFPCPEFLATHIAVHEREADLVALGSLPHPDDLPRTPFLRYLERLRHYDLFLRYGSAERIPLPPLNGNSSIRLEHFRNAGGYDASFSSYGGEDTEMGYRLLRRGLRFVYAPEARGWHYHVKDYAAYRQDMYASGVTMVAIVRRHPEVLSRVNLDLVIAQPAALPAKKRARRAVWQLLARYPGLVAAIEALLVRASRPSWGPILYPFYLVASHYHYACGMRDELARSGPIRGPT